MGKHLTPEDQKLFHEAMKNVEPLKKKEPTVISSSYETSKSYTHPSPYFSNVHQTCSKKDTGPILKNLQNANPMKDNKYTTSSTPSFNKDFGGKLITDLALTLSDPYTLEKTSNDVIHYCKSGVQPKQFTLLKKGKLNIDAELDLHHYTVAEAKERFIYFILEAQNRGYRVLRIIHGKGGKLANPIAVLKSYVYHWLPQLPNVLAYCSCERQGGGSGAVYVLLKRSVD